MKLFLKRYHIPYLFILPFFVLYIIFQLVPNLWTIYISFTEWNMIGDPLWVGGKNYTLLFKDYMFWDALVNTLVYWVTGVVFVLLFALLLSLLLNYKHLRMRTFFRTALFLPNVCAVIAIGLIFSMLFDKNVGLVNEALARMGIAKQDWLTGTSLSKIPPIILNVWRNSPWFMMILLSGLLSISPDYYEAATIDGANGWQKFWRITLPSLSNVLFFCFITLTADNWKIFNEPYILKGPGTSNISLFQYLYESAFQLFKLGYASAIGVILTVALLLISMVQFLIRRRQGEI